MRIAHVITRLIIGGAQENTVLCCQDLSEQFGDDVILITGPGLGPEGSLEDEARGRGVRLKILPELRRAIHPWHDTKSYFAIRRAIREFQPDVVHTHSGKAGLFGRSAAAALGIPAVVHTVHGAPFHPYQSAPARTLFRACERYAARRCHKIVSVADAMTDLLVDAGVTTRDHCTTVYSGFEVEPFLAAGDLRDQTRRQLGYAEDHVVVGKVARLFPLKGHDDLISAAQSACGENPRLRFLLVGEGVLRAPLERRIESAGLAEKFQLLGLVEPRRVPAMLVAMDLVVHTSLREGLARVLPQALIAGKPVVSYNIDGAREVVIPGETGMLVEPGDISGISQAMLELAGDEPLRDRLGRAGRARFTEIFRHQRMTEQLRAIYESLLASSAADLRATPTTATSPDSIE